MPVVNIIDHRSLKDRYDVRVSVVYEASWQDNCIPGATQFPKTSKECVYVKYTNEKWPETPITMYMLYV